MYTSTSLQTDRPIVFNRFGVRGETLGPKNSEYEVLTTNAVVIAEGGHRITTNGPMRAMRLFRETYPHAEVYDIRRIG